MDKLETFKKLYKHFEMMHLRGEISCNPKITYAMLNLFAKLEKDILKDFENVDKVKDEKKELTL